MPDSWFNWKSTTMDEIAELRKHLEAAGRIADKLEDDRGIKTLILRCMILMGPKFVARHRLAATE